LAQRWRDKLVSDVTPDDIYDLVDEVRTKGTPGLKVRTAMSDSAARVALMRLNRFFSWSIQQRLITTNPAAGVWRPPPGASRERVLSDGELKLLWAACDDIGQSFGAALRLLILTGQRRGEVGGMRWDELSEDHDTWTLRGSRTKNGRTHVVPLSRQARDLIASVRRVEGPFVFTSDGRTHAAGWSAVKRRLDFKIAELARAEGTTVPPWVTHDIRRSVATNLQKLGIRLEVTEATLNHVSGARAGIVGVYQRHQYADEKRQALNLWAAHVEKIVDARAKRTLPHPVGVEPASN
jgi:integrase